ncbi:hypothetical protein CHS0354_041203 [Potamilus streckersoni]|uniref:Uncharacterized protein n=1 Tax=Potamilus streckersoni TaxID=2493646 RepID=A0AAE0SEC2_9BIVA|nr:hypothetical protein CHS0354_041203 [Potamilus streckersoni]
MGIGPAESQVCNGVQQTMGIGPAEDHVCNGVQQAMGIGPAENQNCNGVQQAIGIGPAEDQVCNGVQQAMSIGPAEDQCIEQLLGIAALCTWPMDSSTIYGVRKVIFVTLWDKDPAGCPSPARCQSTLWMPQVHPAVHAQHRCRPDPNLKAIWGLYIGKWLYLMLVMGEMKAGLRNWSVGGWSYA